MGPSPQVACPLCPRAAGAARVCKCGPVCTCLRGLCATCTALTWPAGRRSSGACAGVFKEARTCAYGLVHKHPYTIACAPMRARTHCTHQHLYTHMCTHTHTHARKHTHLHTDNSTSTHTHAHKRTFTETLPHTILLTQILAHTDTHTHVRMRTQTDTRACAQADYRLYCARIRPARRGPKSRVGCKRRPILLCGYGSSIDGKARSARAAPQPAAIQAWILLTARTQRAGWHACSHPQSHLRRAFPQPRLKLHLESLLLLAWLPKVLHWVAYTPDPALCNITRALDWNLSTAGAVGNGAA